MRGDGFDGFIFFGREESSLIWTWVVERLLNIQARILRRGEVGAGDINLGPSL